MNIAIDVFFHCFLLKLVFLGTDDYFTIDVLHGLTFFFHGLTFMD